MDEKKFISFIIPAYNAEQTIKRCLESISFISRNDMEVLVIDDGSEDDTSKIQEFILYHKKTLEFHLLEIMELKRQKENTFVLLTQMT